MTLKKSTAVTILNGIVNPLFMCSFLPIVEGKPGLDFQGLTGFWGQLILAIGIAQFVGFCRSLAKQLRRALSFLVLIGTLRAHGFAEPLWALLCSSALSGYLKSRFSQALALSTVCRFSRVGFASWWADGPLSLWAACCLILLSRPLPLRLRANSAKPDTWRKPDRMATKAGREIGRPLFCPCYHKRTFV